MSNSTFLSIIIPAYNEAHRLPASLDQIIAFLDEQPYSAEVLVVENGSQDSTLEIAQAYAGRFSNLRVLQNSLRGKGRAVQQGMLEARGEYRFMCDADLSMPIDQVNRFLPPERVDFDIAIGSREAPGAVRYNEPWYRHLAGRGYNALIRSLALPGLQDTQCGFKCFRGSLATDLFRRQTLMGWSFDVEVLFIASQWGCQIVEVPIPWYFNADSHVRVVRDSVRMGLDLLRIRANALRGAYDAEV